ncbi:hypothetical protein HYZ97_04175 [Candidatus Pacearchaeota archaeon]|nr:hypothetical protein [Candidatus Pacearchaeota archaeon]
MLTVISFSALPSSALEITLQAPDQTGLNASFSVNVSLDSTEVHDIKIFVHNSSDARITRGELISSIYSNDAWKDSWNYVLAAYPQQTSFLIKVTEQPGNHELCAQARKAGKNSYDAKSCLPLLIAAEVLPIEEEMLSEPEQEPEPELDEEEQEITTSASNQTNTSAISSSAEAAGTTEQVEETTRIVLNAPVPETVLSKDAKSRFWLIISFTFFSLLVIFLLLLRKL